MLFIKQDVGYLRMEIFDLNILQQIVIDILESVISFNQLSFRFHTAHKNITKMIDQFLNQQALKPKTGITMSSTMTSQSHDNDKKMVRTQGNKKIVQFYDYSCQFMDDRYDLTGLICGEVVIRDKDSKRVVYEGEFFNSEKYGYGIEYDEKGEVLYEGEFRGGKRQGWGRTKQYEGQFKEDQYDGWGRFFTKEVFYEGYFLEGRYNGVGTYIQANQQFRHIDILMKQSKMDQFLITEIAKDQEELFNKFRIQQIYVGQWLKGLKSGLGKLWKENDFWYSGQLAFNLLHGHGVKRTPETKTQKGVFWKGQYKGSS